MSSLEGRCSSTESVRLRAIRVLQVILSGKSEAKERELNNIKQESMKLVFMGVPFSMQRAVAQFVISFFLFYPRLFHLTVLKVHVFVSHQTEEAKWLKSFWGF
jgi:hypothetical protein